MNFDSLKGLLWGAAVGDALGAPHEFSSEFTYTGHLQYPLIQNSKWHGRHVGVIGQVTDDTEMMIALADSLLEAKKYDANIAKSAYLNWANSDCPFMGKNTRELFHKVTTILGYDARFKRRYATTMQSQSNGCLMRCAPLAALGKAGIEAAAIDCALSNPNPVCIDACQVYIWAAVELGNGKRAAEVCAAAPAKAKMSEVRAVLEAAADNKSTRDVRGMTRGWVLNSLWCAFRALAKDESYETAIDWVIRLGGDTDTNACIAGGLLGAVRGYEAMILEERTKKNINIILTADPTTGALRNQPNLPYRPARLDKLAQDLYNVFGSG